MRIKILVSSLYLPLVFSHLYKETLDENFDLLNGDCAVDQQFIEETVEELLSEAISNALTSNNPEYVCLANCAHFFPMMKNIEVTIGMVVRYSDFDYVTTEIKNKTELLLTFKLRG